jgi:hypothetical protein
MTADEGQRISGLLHERAQYYGQDATGPLNLQIERGGEPLNTVFNISNNKSAYKEYKTSALR